MLCLVYFSCTTLVKTVTLLLVPKYVLVLIPYVLNISCWLPGIAADTLTLFETQVIQRH